MSKLPYMPLYLADYLADTSHLSLEEHGAYLKLIMAYWRNGGPLPADEKRLATIIGTTLRRFRSHFRDLVGEFFDDENGCIVHGRIDAELAASRERSQVNSQKASEAAKARWSKSDATSSAPGMPQAMLEECPSKSKSSLSSGKSNAREPRASLSKDFDEWWAAYPHKVGKTEARRAYDRARKRSPDPPSQAQLLAGLDRYKRSKPPDRAWCNPATWLNQGRWEDEPASAGASATVTPLRTADEWEAIRAGKSV